MMGFSCLLTNRRMKELQTIYVTISPSVQVSYLDVGLITQTLVSQPQTKDQVEALEQICATSQRDLS